MEKGDLVDPLPKNVPANIAHGQVWLVSVDETPDKVFEGKRPHLYLTLIANKPDEWPGNLRLVRSLLHLADLEKLGSQGAVENIHWLLGNFMRKQDWTDNLETHKGRLIRYAHPFDMLGV